jgi:hypothetical protein
VQLTEIRGAKTTKLFSISDCEMISIEGQISKEQEEDDNGYFAMSIMAPTRKLPINQQMHIGIKIQELICS